VGIGLLLLSLELMRRASAPLRDSTLLPVLAGYLDSDQATAFLMMALLTYLLHSSIAAVLLLATLAGHGAIGPDLGIVMMLGVNLGSSFIAPALTRAAEPGYRVVPMANLLMRGVGSGLALTGFLSLRPEIGWLGGTPADQIVNAHILFNLVILLVGLPLSGLAVRISEATMAVLAPASGKTPAAEEQLSALNEAALAQPAQALANATRELIRMCETVELMLDRVIDLYDRADARQFLDLEALDDKVDRRHAMIRLYLSKIAERDMSAAEEQRCEDLLNACLKLEQVGDIISRDLLAQVDRKIRIGVDFAPEDARELHAFHASVMANARLAFNLILTEDIDTARRLVLNKDNLRDIEKEVGHRHFARLRSDSAVDVAASSIQLDSLRDLKQVNSLLTTIAYPVLEAHGQLRGTRLHEQAATG
jgi:phosphate:Na+ symporter